MTVHHVPKCKDCHKVIFVITGRAYCFRDCIYILRPSCFCEIRANYVSWIIYGYLYLQVIHDTQTAQITQNQNVI